MTQFEQFASTLVCKCSEVIIKAQSNGLEKVRAKVVVIKHGKVFAVCKGCNAEVELPLTRNHTQAVSSGPLLYLKK